MTEPLLHEVALTSEEVQRILTVCGPKALLVGGQALAFWALHYGVTPVGVLSAYVTTDIDFVGRAQLATVLQRQLSGNWQLHIASLDDMSPQTAKVYEVLPGNGLKQVDFLCGLVGLDMQCVEKRAVEARLSSAVSLRVLHPLDVLESRLQNLVHLPVKRNAVGVAQAHLAVEVLYAFLNERLAAADLKTVFRGLKRLKHIALNPALSRTAFEYGIDVLKAVPLKRIESEKFHERFWPDVLLRLKTQHERYAAKDLKTKRDA